MKKIKLAYFGSPDFSADFLEKILLDKSLLVKIKLVVTQADSPAGRKQILTPTPVKSIAEKYKRGKDTKFFAVYCFPSKNFGIKLKNIDLALVYAFGKIIPKEILNLPKFGFWNIHPSLLPKYRGPSPIASPLINGETTTGVTIIKMDDKIDHGSIIAQQNLTIEKIDKRPDLEKKLADLAFEMFKKILSDEDTDFSNFSFLEKASIESRLIKQNDKLATYTKKLTKQDGFISIENLTLLMVGKNSPEKFYNLFRGLYPWPGLWTLLRQDFGGQAQKRLKITDMELVNGKIIIKKVQMEGKNEVDFETFNNAYKVF